MTDAFRFFRISDLKKIMPCNPDELAEVNLFQLLDDEELAELAAVVDRSASVAAGEVIFNAGDLGESLFIVGSGRGRAFV